MVALAKFDQFVEDLANKVHDLGADSLKVALTNAANPPLAANTVLADLTQISYAFLASQALTTISATQVGGVLRLIVDDKTLTAAGGAVGPFRYVVIYNDTPAGDPLICYWDIGFEVTLADTEELILDFHDTAGVFSLQ